MKRRSVLAAIGGTLAASGCLSRGDGGTDKTPTTTEQDRQPLARYPCPPSGDDGNTVCFHTLDTDTATIYLRPSTTMTASPRGTLQFTLYNNTNATLVFNPHNWTLWRMKNGTWDHIKQRVVADGKTNVRPGSTTTWSVDEIVDVVNPQFQFTAGVYAVGIEVPVPHSKTWTTCIALVRILTE
jgi:hypothetical protein